ncbi:MAG: tRNA (cytidine(34)-2'-O)-methyltransferase [Eubacteriales bacterium]|nr:tRNA (cytidine(34)-2'-O)-methyltransferase [Eubacteriales bacterium]
MAIEIVLHEPEIPANTGNISRTCVALNLPLHLIEPLGFSIDDKHLKRAGLDYWFDLDLTLWQRIDAFLEAHEGRPIYYATTKAGRVYSDVEYEEDAIFIFGKETRGLPESLMMAHPERMIRIPMAPGIRSLNLSNSVAIVAYEAMRQHGFPKLDLHGQLTGRCD